MKTVVIYDSVFGNTEQVAKRIADVIPGTVKVVKVGGVSMLELGTADLLILGSPTVGGRATKPMQEFVESIPKSVAEKARLAAFDTRISMKFAQIFGYAATRMADALAQKGGELKLPPEGFIVKGRNGPLAEGELDRASAWGKTISRDLQ
jgi:flavodoxin I